ncbi:MAG TPA: signal recognition particle protein [Erysipelotrichaceae bacterium]|nr:signal recognition particle protein [Erysipelotrichaceae bacterium]
MAFESLSEKLNTTFRNLTGKGKLTEKNMEDVLQDIRRAMLEADVNYQVVTTFLASVKEKMVGQKVIDAVDPAEMTVKIVYDELVELLGSEEAEIAYNSQGLTTIMLVGLQGTGKTTSVGKIANVLLKKQSRNPMIIAADVIRPAAIEQLKVLGDSIGVEVFSLGVDVSATETVNQGLAYAKEQGYDTVFIDTAGRLSIDEELMNELAVLKDLARPDEILLTVDAMTGQDIINVAKSFDELLNISGLVVTKLDGDARGGAVLSVKSVTNVPVKFVGDGEKIEDLDIFYPDRMADRIMGMGDIVSLVEKAEEKMDMEAAEASAQRMLEGEFTLDDMLVQFDQINRMGPLSGILKMIPGMGNLTKDLDTDVAEDAMKMNKAIIRSMTPEERNNPKIIRTSRMVRIAKGSGTTRRDVTNLIKQYEKMRTQMRMMGRMFKGGKMPF